MFPLVLSILAFLIATVAFVRALSTHFQEAREIAELRANIERAQQLLRQRGDLANEIAHEIKNPLTAILCSAETLDLLVGANLHEDHRQSLRYIKEYGDNLLRLVSDFLDVSRAESGHIEARPEQFPVVPCVESVIGLLKANALKKNITVQLAIPEEPLDSFCDPRHFKQIIFNLLHNALKFTPTNGQVQVAIERNFPFPSVKIVVRDTGPGMSEEQLKNLFQLYARYDSGKPEGSAGVGLGLALCKGLVEMNQGSICCESRVGVGTAFTVTVPFAEQRAEPPRTLSGAYLMRSSEAPLRVSDAPRPLEGQKFLLVDKDEGARNAVATLINAWGGLVDAVSQATEAVKALEDRTYDAVMIDDSLQGLDSLELIKRIKDGSSSKDTTVIIAASNPESAELAHAGAADKCVAKPLNGRLLLKSLANSGKYNTTH